MYAPATWGRIETGLQQRDPHVRLQLVARILLALATAVCAQTPGLAPSALPPAGGAPALNTPALAPGIPGAVAPAAAPSEATTADGPTLQKVRYWLGSPTLKGWVEGSDPCSGWQGVGCKDGRVVSLSLDSLGLKGSLPPDVSELGFLQVLNMSTNGFTGALPDSWGYPGAMPNLTVLLLDNNQLQGSLPSAWANTGSLQNLVLLNLGYNNLSGHLPDNWGTGGLANLRVLSLKHNLLSGSLPATWGNGNWSLPNMAVMALDNNLLSGPLPDDWSQGWASLSLLSMTHNLLEGALPAAWGQTGSFPKLQILSINNNMFTGDLPYTWGSASSFPAMRNPSSGVVLFPGNDNMTGSIPAGVPLQILKFDTGNRYIRCTYLPCIQDVALAAAPITGPPEGIVPPLLAPSLGPATSLSVVPSGSAVAAHAPAGIAEATAQQGPTQTLTATVNLVGPTTLSDADRSAITKTAAAEAGVDPASVSIGHVTDLAKAAPAPAFSVSSARRLLAEGTTGPGVQVQLLINGTRDALKSAQEKLQSSVDSGAFVDSLKKAGVKVEGMSLGSAPRGTPSAPAAPAEAAPAVVDRAAPQGPSVNKGAIIGGVIGGVAAALLVGALLVYLCCCRKPRAKVDKHAAPKAEKPVAKEGPPAVPKEERKKESPKTALSKSSPPKAPIATSAPDGKKGDPPAPSTPPGVTPAPAVDTASPETDGALTRAHSESTTKKTNLVPYSEYRKKRLQNIRKESGLDGVPTSSSPQTSGRTPSSLLETR